MNGNLVFQKRTFYFLIALLLVSIPFSNIFAQEGLSISGAPVISFPMGDSADLYSLGIGGSIEARFPLSSGSFYGFGQINYQNVLLQASAGNLHLLSGGGGIIVMPFKTPFMSAGVHLGGGAYLGFFQDADPLANPYYSVGLSGDFSFGKGFSLSLNPGYRNLIAMVDGQLSALYSGMEVSLQFTFEPGAMGGGTRRPKLKILSPEFNQIFPVIYKYYDKNPIGSVVIKNEESRTIKDIKIEFFVPQYMDGPQVIAEIDELRTKEVMEIPITALFKNDVLEITEKDSAQSQIIITYTVGGTSLTANRNESLRIYDRNSINWDDDRKAAAFVTAKDPTILKFSRNVTSEIGSLKGSILNRNLSDGIALFEALREYGLEYKIDPDSSYEILSQDESLADYLQFPVQTLDYKTGDCDDLAILYSSMLEAVSVETAFITTPGHIYMAFSLGLKESQAEKIFSRTDNLIIIDGAAWMPVETTLLNEGFLKAWETGARLWREAVVHETEGFIPIRSAWSVYEPTWFGSGENRSVVERIPPSSRIADIYKSSMNQFVQFQITPLVERMEERIAQRSSSRLINQFGTLYARYGLMDKAEVQFKKAAGNDYVPSIVNLGNIFFLKENFRQASSYYEKAYKLNSDSTDVLLALARTEFALEQYRKAQEYYDIAMMLDPDRAGKFTYITGGSTETGRASDVRERKAVLWSEE